MALLYEDGLYEDGLVRDDIRDAIQAAALADHYDLAAEIAERHGWKGICLRCANVAPTTMVTYENRNGTWPVCGPCQVALTPNRLVFRPGAAPSGNNYADWAKLVAAAARIGGVKSIGFDDSIEPIVIPSGTWDMSGCVLHGDRPFQPITSDNATIRNLREVRDLSITGVTFSNGGR